MLHSGTLLGSTYSFSFPNSHFFVWLFSFRTKKLKFLLIYCLFCISIKILFEKKNSTAFPSPFKWSDWSLILKQQTCSLTFKGPMMDRTITLYSVTSTGNYALYVMYADWHNFAHNHIQTPCPIRQLTKLPSNVIIYKFDITKKCIPSKIKIFVHYKILLNLIIDGSIVWHTN